MTVTILRRLAAAALCLAAASPASAINEMFAKDAPVSRMTAEDFRIAGEAMRKALDEGRDGQTYEWKNPATNASGTITPLARFEKNGMQCRGAAFASDVKGAKGRSQWNLCKSAQGWKVLEGR
ncbi:MAG TPA: RT0821/Lpp0805 family surface protein [Usitatibacter sp.]|nr:RT0821/Lpp0805 family surface protein [Usitatibacter sp.]